MTKHYIELHGKPLSPRLPNLGGVTLTNQSSYPLPFSLSFIDVILIQSFPSLIDHFIRSLAHRTSGPKTVGGPSALEAHFTIATELGQQPVLAKALRTFREGPDAPHRSTPVSVPNPANAPPARKPSKRIATDPAVRVLIIVLDLRDSKAFID